MNTQECLYNAQGNITENRFYIGDYEIFTKTTNGTLDTERETLHISDDKQKVALIDYDTQNQSTTIRYQLTNHLDSASLELDQNADIISYEEYHPFGTTSYRSGRSETEVSLKRYKYVFKELDNETGLYYYGMRYYAPWVARFVSVDPLQSDYPYYTPFQYAGNKPISYIDLDGAEEAESELLNIGKQLRNTTFTSANENIEEQEEKRGVIKGDYYDYQNNYLGSTGFEGKAIYRVHNADWMKYIGRTMSSEEDNMNTSELFGIYLLHSQNLVKYQGLQWKKIEPVIDTTQFVGWNTYKHCFKNANAQLWVSDVEMSGYNSSILMFNEYQGINPDSNIIMKGINTIQTELIEGNPIGVGMHYKAGDGGGNFDRTTDHWITIVGQGYIRGRGNYFRFFENSTEYRPMGTEKSNRLYLTLGTSYPLKSGFGLKLSVNRSNMDFTNILTTVRPNIIYNKNKGTIYKSLYNK